MARSRTGNSTIKDITLFPIVYLAERFTSRKDAEGNRKDDIFFTDVAEGTAKAIMRGSEFDHFVIAWEGKTIWQQGGDHYDLGDVIDGDDGDHLLGGYRFIGIPPLNKVHKYRLKWRGVDLRGNPQEERSELIDYVLLKKDVYYIEVKAAETGGEEEWVPVDVGCLVTVRITNPYKAVFRAQNWLTALTNLIVPQVGDFVSKETYGSLSSDREGFQGRIIQHLWNDPYVPEPASGPEQTAAAPNCRSGENEPECAVDHLPFVAYMEETYGALIEDFRIGPINISENISPESLAGISLQKFTERMKQRGQLEVAKGKVLISQEERKQTIIQATGEAKRVDIVTHAWRKAGDLGMLIRTLEAMEKSTAAFQYSIHDIPQLRDLFGGLGFRPSKEGTINRDEIAELKDILRGLQGGAQKEAGSSAAPVVSSPESESESESESHPASSQDRGEEPETEEPQH